MTVRTSNALWLEVLEASPVVGVPIEVDLYSGADPTTMVATLEGAFEKQFQIELGDVGSFSFKIARDDPKAALIHDDDLIKFKVAGIYRFSGFVETPVHTPTEAAGVRTIAGRGGMGYSERATTYPPGWPTPTGVETAYTNAHGAQMLLDGITAAKARGSLPNLQPLDWTGLVDTQNRPWVDTATITVHAGQSLLDLIRNLVAYGSFEAIMTHDLRLRLYVEKSRHFEDTIIFRRGRHIIDPGVEKVGHRSGLRSRYLIEGQGGKFLEVSDPLLEADTRVGRREAYLSVTSSADPTTLQRAGEAALAASELDTRAYQIPLMHGTGPGDLEPWADYDIGDWVRVDDPGSLDLEAVRLVSFTVEETEGGDYKLTADANSIALESDLRLQRQLAALAGSTGGGGISTASFSLGGGSATSDGRVGVEIGDQLGYLADKLDTGLGLVQAVIPGGSDKLRFSLAANLDDLADVDMTGVADGDAPVWSASAAKYIPGSTGGAITAIDGGGP